MNIWWIPCLILMCIGLALINSGFSRRGFSLFSLFKSLAALFMSVLSFFVFFPLILGVLGYEPVGTFSQIMSASFLAISVLILLGAGIERLSLGGGLAVLFLWQFLVYLPFYLITQPDGFLVEEWGLRDFAGGLLVHATTGASALGLAAIKGRRLEFFNLRKSSHLGLFGLGALFLFTGWLAFNSSGGDNIDEILYSIKTTVLAGATGFFTWSVLDRLHPPGRNSIKGSVFGLISGMVVITPGAGWLSEVSTLVAAGSGTLVAFYAALFIEKALRIDDELKVFASHFVTSWVGAVFVSWHFSEIGFVVDILVPVFTGLYCFFATAGAALLVGKFTNLCISRRQEEESPDLLILGESLIEI